MKLNIPQLEQLIQQQMAAAQTPGLALAIFQAGEVIYTNGFGVTSVEDGGLAVTPQTLFRIGMLTMPLTGAAIMRLVEAGQLNLDTPIKHYLPDFELSTQGAAAQITLRHLLNATAGLPSDYQPYGRRDPAGLHDYVYDEIAHFSLATPPGKIFRYSTPSTDLAGYVAERVGGLRFSQLTQDLLFDPLAMRRTTFDPLVAMTYPLAQSHRLDDDGVLQVERRFAENTGCYPSSFAISTVLDLANFAQMLLQQGRFHEIQLLPSALATEMQTRQIDLHNVDNEGWGFGFSHMSYKGVKLLYCLGLMGGYGSILALAPEVGIAVIMLLNHVTNVNSTTDPILYTILDQLLDLPQVVPQRVHVSANKPLWPRYVGTYLGHDGGGLISIAIVDEHLTVDWNGEQSTLAALGSERYYAENATATMSYWEAVWANVCVGFVPEAAGPTQFIVVNGEWSCRRMEATDFPPVDPMIWPKLVGTYSLEHGEIVLTVTVEEGRLHIHYNFFDIAFPCIALGDNRFASKLGVLTFQDEHDGQMQAIQGVANALYRR